MATDSEIPTEEFETDWVNYWDANPEDHGGRFLRWDDEGGYWDIVEVTPCATAMPSGSEHEYLISQIQVYPDNVWEEGNPENGFTDDMESILESLRDEHHKEAPAGEPFINHIGYYVSDFVHYISDPYSSIVDVNDYEDYEDMVESYGVEDWE